MGMGEEKSEMKDKDSEYRARPTVAQGFERLMGAGRMWEAEKPVGGA